MQAASLSKPAWWQALLERGTILSPGAVISPSYGSPFFPQNKQRNKQNRTKKKQQQQQQKKNNNHVVLFKQSHLRLFACLCLPKLCWGRRALMRLSRQVVWQELGPHQDRSWVSVSPVIAFALSGAFWRASERKPMPSPCRNHLVFTVTLVPSALAQISRILVKQPEHLCSLILNL